MANGSVGFTSVMDDMRQMKAVISQIPVFRVHPDVRDEWRRAADLLEKGSEEEAVSVGADAVKSIRNMLGAFLRSSVIGKAIGDVRQPGHFQKLVDERDADNYDEDVVGSLRKKLSDLEEAVRAETNGTFEQRVAAYTAMSQAIESADQEQKKRDEKRRVQAAADKKAAKVAKEESTRVANRQAALAQQRQAEEQRRQVAADARSIL